MCKNHKISIEARICKTCKVEKALDLYSKHKKGRGGYRISCKECESQIQKDYRARYNLIKANTKKLICKVCKNAFTHLTNKAVYCSDKCRISDHTYNCVCCGKKSYSKNKNARFCSLSCMNACRVHINKEKGVKEIACDNCGNQFLPITKRNRFCSKACHGEYLKLKNHSLKYKERPCKHCSQTFKPALKIQKYCCVTCQKTAYRKKENANPFKRLNKNFARTVSTGLLHGKGGISWQKLLGYTVKDLIKHLESKFHPNQQTGEMMSWDNYGRGGWHVDHIIPQYYFAYLKRTDKQFKICWSLDNLQPLWEFENCSKNKSIRPKDVSNAKRFITTWARWYGPKDVLDSNFFINKDQAPNIYYIGRNGSFNEIGESAFLEELQERFNNDMYLVANYKKGRI